MFLHLLIIIHVVVLVLRDLLPSSLILATSRLLLVLGVPVDSLHHNIVPVLRVDPVVVVDVPLEGSAENPPLHNIAKRKTIKIAKSFAQ